MAEQTRLRVLIETPGIGQLSKLRGSLTQVDVAAKGLGNNFAKARIELKRTEQTSKTTVNSTRALRDSFRELANSVEFGSKRFKVATREAERLDKQLAKMEQRKGGGGRLAGIAKGVGTIAGGAVFGGPEGAVGAGAGLAFGGHAGGIVGAAIGAQVGQLRQALGATAEYAAELNKLRIALRGVTTSQAEYDNALQFITQSTKDFAIPQSVLTRQFTKLQASVSGAGGDLNDTETAFKGIVAAVRATGGSLADVDAALTATAQVFSKGKVSAEELRQQIGERLPGAFTLFAESMGKTPQELDKALEKGQVSLQDFQKFAEAIFKRYGQTALEIADGPDAAGDRLKTNLEELNEEVGKLLKPIGEAFQTVFGDIVESITDATKKFNEFAQDLQRRELAMYRRKRAGAVAGSPEAIFNDQMIAELETQLGLRGMYGPELPDRFKPKTKLPGITEDTTESKVAKERFRMSERLVELRSRARREENEKRRIALELESKILELEERGIEGTELRDRLDQASLQAKKEMLKVDKDRKKEFDKLIESFTLQGAKMFDLNAEGEGPKTPFDMLRQGADDFTDSLKGALEASKQLAQVGLQGISDGITNLVVNGTLNFREFAASLLRDMARIIMQQIVMKSLMQALGFGGGLDLSSFFVKNRNPVDVSKVSADLSQFRPGAVKLMAKGGITRGVSIAGEAGPEAVVPLPDGRSIPVRMQGEGAKVVVNVDATGSSVEGDPGQAKQLGNAIGAAVRQELIKQKRPGGLLS